MIIQIVLDLNENIELLGRSFVERLLKKTFNLTSKMAAFS